MLKIMHTEASRGWGGQEIRILSEINELKKKGHELYLISQYEAEILKHIPINSAKIFNTSMRFAVDPFAIIKIAGILKKEKINIINTHSSLDSWNAGIAGRISKVPLIIRTRHLSTRISGTFPYKKLADIIITTGSSIRDELISMHGINPDKIISIPTGIKIEKFNPDIKRERTLRDEFKIDRETIILGIIAIIRKWKGHKVLLSALRGLIDKKIKIKLFIVGEGPSRNVIENYIEELKLTNDVILLGYREDIPYILSAIDIFVLPSTANEGVPQAIIQALAMKKAVVASNIGSISDIIKHDETGLLVKPGDIEDLQINLTELIENRDKREFLGLMGRMLVEKEFTIEKMIDRIEGIYNERLTGDKIT